MSDRGRFSGFCWHEEYHTVDRKKEKAADCSYLTQGRICTNKKCSQYGEKCFVATHCPYRFREHGPIKRKNSQQHSSRTMRIVSINCTIPVGAPIYSHSLGKGSYLSFDSKFRIISVSFENEVKRFQYPEAFTQGHICCPGEVYQRVSHDIEFAVRE